MKTQYIRPAGRPIREPWWKRVLVPLGVYAAVFTVTAIMAAVLVEWAVGCGDTYIDAKGVHHANECVFIQLR